MKANSIRRVQLVLVLVAVVAAFLLGRFSPAIGGLPPSVVIVAVLVAAVLLSVWPVGGANPQRRPAAGQRRKRPASRRQTNRRPKSGQWYHWD
jgi:hypothetical protein